jgi:hypothetical protein
MGALVFKWLSISQNGAEIKSGMAIASHTTCSFSTTAGERNNLLSTRSYTMMVLKLQRSMLLTRPSYVHEASFEKLLNLGQGSEAQFEAKTNGNTLGVFNNLFTQSMSASLTSWGSGPRIASSVASPSAALASTSTFEELAGASAFAIDGPFAEAVAVMV